MKTSLLLASALLICPAIAGAQGDTVETYDDIQERVIALNEAGDCAAIWKELSLPLRQGEPRAALDLLFLGYTSGFTPPGPPSDIATTTRDYYTLAVHSLAAEDSAGREMAQEMVAASDYGVAGQALGQCLASDASGAICAAQALKARLVPDLDSFMAELDARATLPGAVPAHCGGIE